MKWQKTPQSVVIKTVVRLLTPLNVSYQITRSFWRCCTHRCDVMITTYQRKSTLYSHNMDWHFLGCQILRFLALVQCERGQWIWLLFMRTFFRYFCTLLVFAHYVFAHYVSCFGCLWFLCTMVLFLTSKQPWVSSLYFAAGILKGRRKS